MEHLNDTAGYIYLSHKGTLECPQTCRVQWTPPAGTAFVTLRPAGMMTYWNNVTQTSEWRHVTLRIDQCDNLTLVCHFRSQEQFELTFPAPKAVHIEIELTLNEVGFVTEWNGYQMWFEGKFWLSLQIPVGHSQLKTFFRGRN